MKTLPLSKGIEIFYSDLPLGSGPTAHYWLMGKLRVGTEFSAWYSLINKLYSFCLGVTETQMFSLFFSLTASIRQVSTSNAFEENIPLTQKRQSLWTLKKREVGLKAMLISYDPAITRYLLADVRKWTSSHVREERRNNSTVCAKLTWGKKPISRI